MLNWIWSRLVRYPVTILNYMEYKYQKISLNERTVEYRFVFDQLLKKPGERVLDVGTGTTPLPAIIRSCGFHVTAIDNIKDFWPNEMFNRHWTVLDQSILEPNLGGYFDFITCISVLEHIKEFNLAVKQMVSLLPEGGMLLLTFPYSEDEYVENVYERPLSDAHGKFVPYSCQVFSRSELNYWQDEFGLHIEDQEYWKFYNEKFWSEGQRLPVPTRVSREHLHQISCVSLKKIK